MSKPPIAPSVPTLTGRATAIDAQVEIIAATAPTEIEAAVSASVELERLQLENDKLGAEVETLQQDREERKKYAHRVFILMAAWLAAMIVLVTLAGFKTSWYSFSLSDAVILAMIGSTTASVIGIFLIVATYLFPKRS
jgi:hypothetical protein